MTPATDDDALEAAFEALLAGRSAPPAAGGLVAFTDGVRATAARPPRPNAALADLLATGLLTDQSSEPAPRAVRSRRRSTRMFLAFLTKCATAGIGLKAATVAGVVVVGVTTAGLTNELPTPIQAPFDQVTHVHSADEAPETDSTDSTDDGDTGAPGTTTAATTSTAPESTDSETQDSEKADGSATQAVTAPSTVSAQQTPTHPENFGGTVSSMAHNGGVDGGTVSSLAHQRNELRHPGATSSAPVSPSTATGGTSGPGSKGKGHPNG